MSSDELQRVAAAIETLLAPGGDSGQQRQADTWLNNFSSTREAWQVSLGLLQHPRVEVAYFSAHILLTKTRREWRSLSPEERAALSAAASGALVPAAGRPLVAQRLCLVLAAAGARSAPPEAAQFVRQALALGSSAGGSLPLSLTLLRALAEEAEETAPAKRAALLTPLLPALPEVLALCERALAEPAGTSRADVLLCVLAWLRLHPDSPGGGAACGGFLQLSPPALARAAPALFAAALETLGADDEADAAAAADLLVDAQSSGTARDAPADEAATAAHVISALLALQPKAAAPDGEATARVVARVATALAERHLAALSAGEGQWLHLVQLVFDTVAARPERACMDACADFFLSVNTVPVAQRHPALREPLFSALLSRALAHAALPQSWRGWADAGSGGGGDCDDEDAVQRFREQTLADLLESAYLQLRGPFLAALGPGLSPGAPWPHTEAALFALRCVVIPLRERALGERAADAGAPGAAEDRAAANAFLAQLAARVAAEEATFGAHPLVIEATCRTLGAYAAWLGRAPAGRPHTQGCTAYLLRALGVPTALPHAASALRNVCARCADVLSEPATLASLIATAHACLPPPPPPPPPGAEPGPDDRAVVIEGLARLVAQLPPPDAAAAGLALTAPILARAGACAAVAQGPTPGSAHALAAELFLLAAAVRFMQCGGEAGAPPPVLAVLQAAWPVLAAVGDSASWRCEPAVVAALADVYSRAFLCARADAAPLLPPALRTLLGALEEHGHAPCLDALATAVEVFAPPAAHDASAQPRDPAVQAALADALERAARAARALCSVRGAAAVPDSLRALFELAHRAALFDPPVLLRLPAIEPLMVLAVEGVRLREREPCRAAAQLLVALLSPGRQMMLWGDAWRAARPAVDAMVSRYGSQLVAALLDAGAATAQRSVAPALGGVLYALLKGYPAVAPQWLAAAVTAPDFPLAAAAAAAAAEGGSRGDAATAATAAGPSPFGQEEKQLFLRAALRDPPLPQPRFEALFADVAKICRREESADALLSYEL